MGLIANHDLFEILKGKDIYLDNDFLCRLLKDSKFSEEFLKISIKSFLRIDPLIEFEFYRDLYEPKSLQTRKNFLSSNAFNLIADTSEFFLKIKENALLLSKIYKLQNENGASLTDFFLAARIMVSYKNSLLITGNKKHFPSCVFNIEGVVNTEHPQNGSINSFSVLSFNKEQFDTFFEKLDQITNKKTDNHIKISFRINLDNFN
ncbi:MAG: hypothetical protein PHS06_04295 [Candidatus Shapirobacteria bacterium]|nr:hypothetical protein [Candidatus Shapirobacteria bacterium]